MFTGIVEATGEVLAVETTDDGRRLRIAVPFSTLTAGQSVSVSGVCLTVEAFDLDPSGGWMTVFLAEETLARTYLGDLAEGDVLNLERAMPADGRFDGHVVQGHVDATGEVLGVERTGVEELPEDAPENVSPAVTQAVSADAYDGDWSYTFSLPDALSPYVVEKGSIAIDGISLTVASLEDGEMTVAIVPTTYAETTLSEKSAGDPVHYEVDVLAKYVEKQIEGGKSRGIRTVEGSDAIGL